MSPEDINSHAKKLAAASEVFQSSHDVTFDLPFLSKGTPHHKHGFRLLWADPRALLIALMQSFLVGLMATITFNVIFGQPYDFGYVNKPPPSKTIWSAITEPVSFSTTHNYVLSTPSPEDINIPENPFPEWVIHVFPNPPVPAKYPPSITLTNEPRMFVPEIKFPKKMATLFVNFIPFLLLINVGHLLIGRFIMRVKPKNILWPLFKTLWLSLLPLRIFASLLLPSWFSLSGDSRTIMSFQARLLQFFTLYKSISGRPAEVAEHDLALACQHHGRDLLDSYATYVILWALCLFPAIILFLVAGAEGAFAYAFLVAFSRAALGAYTFDILNRQRAETDAFIAGNDHFKRAS